MENKGFTSIDEYIQTFPEATQKRLKEMRSLIKAAAPEASEKISYQMPTFYLNGNLVHFAAFKNHIGFYPAPTGVAAFQDDLKAYKQGKGSVQFPLDEPLPVDLIRRIVAYRVEENMRKPEKKARK